MTKYRDSEGRLFQSRDCEEKSRLESTNRHLLRAYEKLSDNHILLIRKNSELQQAKVNDRHIIELQKQEIEELECNYQNLKFSHAIRQALIYVMFLLIIVLSISTIVLFTKLH